tara:strand:+ start:434 stop:883 length:450 start_codon:yes stop_codon:yes gene_type:complete
MVLFVILKYFISALKYMCKLCDKDSTSHSFYKIASEGKKSLYYSCPSEATSWDKEPIVAHFREVLDSKPREGAWVWIFDGKGFGLRHSLHVSTSLAIMRLITEYCDTLDEIRIVNSTRYVKAIFNTIVPLMNPKLKNKISWKSSSTNTK